MSDITIRLLGTFFALVFGLFVTGSIVLTYKLSGNRTTMGIIGLIGGLVIAFGFALFRLHMAEDRHDFLVAAGLAVVEIGCIVTLEWIGTHQRRNYAEWRTAKTAYDQKAGQLEAVQAEEGKRLGALQQTRLEMSNHIQYIDERLLRRVKAPELEDAAVRATREGYLAGIDFNRQKIQSA